MLSRAITPKRRGRRPLTAIAVVTVVVGLLGLAGTALAVHDETFQLDGDVIASTTTTKGGTTQNFDWDSIFDSAGDVKASLPTGFGSASFFPDFRTNANGTFNTADPTTFATGSKDTLPITPGWQCNFDNNVNSKIDVMNAYTVAYENPDGDELLYFALERNTNTGDANVGFWFLQDEVGCLANSGTQPFTGDHLDGDILIVSQFSNGGTVSTINVYRWDRNNGDPDCTADPEPDPTDCVRNDPSDLGELNPNPVGGGVDCRNPSTLPDDPACAAANTVANGPAANGTINTPWLTANFKDKVGHSLRTSEFFEGGINLTDLDLGGKCFSSFLGDTRSSTSLTATLFDFAGGTVGECETTVETDAGGTDNGGIASPTSIGDGSVSSGTDTATITITGADEWAGELTFFLCGPDSTLTSCDMDLGYEVSSGAVDQDSTGADLVSGDVQITSAGTYCWTAHFEPDADTAAAGIGAGDDDGTNECFTVAPVTPTLSTAAGLDVTLGQALSDSATLSGAATEPGTNGGNTEYPSIGATDLAYAGTITFLLKGPSDTGCGDDATGTGTNPQTVNVTGNGVYGPVYFTPDAVGNFHWQATYTNTDSPNNTSPVTHNANCDETAEDVTVTGSAAFTTEQNWLPNDSATVTAPTGTTLNGELTFTLFGSDDCSGSALYTESFTITTGDPTGETRTTTNGADLDPGDFYLATASGDFSWLVSYDDDALSDPADSCKEDSNLEIDNVTDPS